MQSTHKPYTGVIGALMHEYKIAIEDLKANIAGINPVQMVKVVDIQTANKDCVSVQAILTHIVYCGYNYITMMDIDRGNENSPWLPRVKHNSIEEYNAALDKLYEDQYAFFASIPNSEMARYEPENKLTTFWGQLYDYEQLMEHAIIHIYRHRRQIQEFKRQLT